MIVTDVVHVNKTTSAIALHPILVLNIPLEINLPSSNMITVAGGDDALLIINEFLFLPKLLCMSCSSVVVVRSTRTALHTLLPRATPGEIPLSLIKLELVRDRQLAQFYHFSSSASFKFKIKIGFAPRSQAGRSIGS